jgi:hypothetical protein
MQTSLAASLRSTSRVFWEEEARRKSKDDDYEKDLGKLTEQEDGNLTRMVVESLKHDK